MSPDRLKHEIDAVFQIVKDRSSGDELMIVCPVPGCEDRSGNRSVNLKTLYTNCWRCRDSQPHHVKTLFRAAGLEFQDDQLAGVKEMADFFRGEVKKAITPVQDILLPDGFKMLSRNRKSCYWLFCKNMAERKNLGIEDLEEVDAGFTRDGPWEPFCIFPVCEGQRIVYYQGRTYSDEGFDTTKKFPSKKEVPYGPSYWVYNLDALEPTSVNTVVVVESILNVLSLRKKLREMKLDREIVPVCIFTHRISASQVAKFKRYQHIKEWCILFDSDSTGLAMEAGVKLKPLLPMRVAKMPTGKNKDGSVRATNDANDDVMAALCAVADSVVPSEGEAMLHKLKNLKKPMAGCGPLSIRE